MTTNRPLAVVAVFQQVHDAQEAIAALKEAGFRDDQIGLAARRLNTTEPATTKVEDLRDTTGETYVGEGAVAGVAAGAGLGALAGLAILAGMLPPIGPAVAGGTLAVILSSAAAGAAAVGLAGALAGLGVTKEEAEFYESEFHSGRIVIAVTAAGREDEARTIFHRFGGYDMSMGTSMSTGSVDSAETESSPHSIPVAMPMEPGVPVSLAGEIIEPQHKLDVPVRSEDLVGESDPTRRTTIRVPVQPEDIQTPSQHSHPEK